MLDQRCNLLTSFIAISRVKKNWALDWLTFRACICVYVCVSALLREPLSPPPGVHPTSFQRDSRLTLVRSINRLGKRLMMWNRVQQTFRDLGISKSLVFFSPSFRLLDFRYLMFCLLIFVFLFILSLPYPAYIDLVALPIVSSCVR